MEGSIGRTKVLGAVFSLLLCLAVPLSLAQNSVAEPTEYVSNISAMPENLMYPSVVEDGGKLYVIGGLVDDIYGSTPSVTSLYIYDIATGETTRGADMDNGVTWAESAKGIDGRIYVFGGYNSSMGYTAMTQIYDISDNAWSLGTPSPNLLGGGSAVTVANGTIILIGSYASNSVSTLAYDPVGDSWSSMADQPVSVQARKAAYWDESAIFVMGGDGGGAASASLYRFDPLANTWTELEQMPYAAMMGGVATGKNGIVYHFGGVDGSWADGGPQLSQIQKYDPATDTWSVSTISSLSPARSGLGYATDGYGRIFAVCGYDGFNVVPTVSMIIPTNLVFDELEIVSPTDGAIVSGDVTISVAFSTPYIGMPVIEVFVDGVFLDSQTAPWLGGTVSFVWDTTGLVAGSTHVIMTRGTLWNGEMRQDSVTVRVSDQSVEERVAAIEQQLADVQTQLTDLELQLTDVQSKLTVQDANLTALRAQANALQAQLNGLQAALTIMGASQTAAMAALNVTLADLQLQLDALQEQIDRVETKADNGGTYGMVTLVLVIVVIALLAMMFMMSRKKP